MEDLFDTELVIEASRRMLHRGIDAKCDEALHFIARCRGQQQRRFNEKLDVQERQTVKWPADIRWAEEFMRPAQIEILTIRVPTK